MSQSQYVCARCGLAVYTWGEAGTWKHAAGGRVKSCGKLPMVRARADLEREGRELAAAADAYLNRVTK